MKIIKVLKESCIYLVFAVLLICMKFNISNQILYEFWKPIIDNFILLILLFFMFLNSFKWNWFSKRILYSLIFILFLNTYATLFGLPLAIYLQWYFIPLISIVLTFAVSSILKISYKLYSLWRNGKIKLY